jgi:hypothetical protein
MKDFQGYGTYQNRVRCSGPGGGNVLAVQQDRFDLRHILEPRHAMILFFQSTNSSTNVAT